MPLNSLLFFVTRAVVFFLSCNAVITFSKFFAAYFCLVISLQFIKIINLFALNLTALSDFTIIELNTTDSTNNYAMQLIDANKAHHGLTIAAKPKQVVRDNEARRGWTGRGIPVDEYYFNAPKANKGAICV